MLLSIVTFFFDLLGCGWRLLCWVADLSVRFCGAFLRFGAKAVGAVFDLLLSPFSWSIDRMWDLGWNLPRLFGGVLVLLLSACAALALVAFAANAYRRFRRR